jgi:hypothetical protein
MGYPENPETIVIKNNFYPRGLTELQVWKHYNKYRKEIISFINNRPIILFVYTDVNIPIVVRKKKNNFFTITDENFDIINGRTVCISVEQMKNIDYFCLDIDAGDSIKEISKKLCVQDLIKYLNGTSFVKDHKVFLSATSYHIHGMLSRKMNIDTVRTVLQKEMSVLFGDKFLINERKALKDDNINIDLSPVYYRGSHPVPFSLSRNGLIYMDITKTWKNFDRRKAVVTNG